MRKSKNQNLKTSQKPKPNGVKAFDVVNLGIPGQPTAVTSQSLRSLKRLGVVPFTGDRGVKNQYPNEINALLRESPTLLSVVRSKTDYTVGDEIQIEGSQIEPDTVVNNKGETFREVFEQLAFGFHGHSSAWLQLVKSGDTIAPFVIDPAKVRYKQLDEGQGEYSHVLIHKDWGSKTKAADVTEIAIYKEGREWTEVDGRQVCMVHIRSIFGNVEPYSIPDWIGAQTYAKCEYLAGLFNFTALENGMFSGGVLSIVKPSDSGYSDEELVNKYRDKLFGTESGNAMKVLIQIVESLDEKATDWQAFNDVKDGHFESLSKLCTEKIVTACRWYGSLAGLQTAGQLGANQQILNEYRVAVKSVQKARNRILATLQNTFFKERGESAVTIEVANEAPVSSDRWDAMHLNAVRDLMESNIEDQRMSAILQVAFGMSEEDADKILYS